jgi:hypothetical protein
MIFVILAISEGDMTNSSYSFVLTCYGVNVDDWNLGEKDFWLRLRQPRILAIPPCAVEEQPVHVNTCKQRTHKHTQTTYMLTPVNNVHINTCKQNTLKHLYAIYTQTPVNNTHM